MSNVLNPKTMKKGHLLFLVLALLAITILPSTSFASAADQSIKDGVAFAVKIVKLIIYGLMAATFIYMIVLLLQALKAWKDPNDREGSVGGIMAVLFVGLAVMGIIFLLGEEAIDYINTNIVVTQLEPVMNIATALA